MSVLINYLSIKIVKMLIFYGLYFTLIDKVSKQKKEQERIEKERMRRLMAEDEEVNHITK